MMKKNKRVTQSQIAQELGVSLATVSRIRSADRNPTLDLMVKLDEVYGWPISKQAVLYKQGLWLEGFETRIQQMEPRA
jgi:transcriptional regulator with XRE-family HTH domain